MLQENAKHLHIMNARVRIRPRVNARAKDENTLNGLKIILRMFQTILSIIMTLMIVIHLNLQITHIPPILVSVPSINSSSILFAIVNPILCADDFSLTTGTIVFKLCKNIEPVSKWTLETFQILDGLITASRRHFRNNE